MQRSSEVRFGRISKTRGARALSDAWRILRDLVGGFVLLAVWLALWGWVLLGVMGPRSAGEPGSDRLGTAPALVERA